MTHPPPPGAAPPPPGVAPPPPGAASPPPGVAPPPHSGRRNRFTLLCYTQCVCVRACVCPLISIVFAPCTRAPPYYSFFAFVFRSRSQHRVTIDKFSRLALGRRHTCCVCIRLPVSVTAPRYKRGIPEDWSPHLNLANIL